MSLKTNVLFIELFRNSFSNTSFPKSTEPSIDILRCINLLKKNKFTVDFLDVKTTPISHKNFNKTLHKKNYSFIFIDCKSYNKKHAYSIIKTIEENTTSVVFCFGQYPSACFEQLLQVHKKIYIIRDEIYAFFESFTKTDFLKNSNKENIPNLIYVDPETKQIVKTHYKEVTELDTLPTLDISILKKNNYYTLYPMKTNIGKWSFINLTKGCSHNCIYCSQTLRISHGDKVYTFTPQEAINRIKRLTDAGFSRIRFVDDNFFSSPVFTKKLLNLFIENNLKIKWMAQARPDSINREIIELCKKTGCECLNIGVESGSQKILDILNKQTTVSDIEQCFSLCREHDILTVAYIILGSPQETLSDVKQTIKLIKKIKPTMLQTAYFTPYPTSPYYEKNIKDNNSSCMDDIFHYSTPTCNISDIDDKTLKKLMKQIIFNFYLNPFYSLPFYKYCLLSFLTNPFFTIYLFYKTLKYILFYPYRKLKNGNS